MKKITEIKLIVNDNSINLKWSILNVYVSVLIRFFFSKLENIKPSLVNTRKLEMKNALYNINDDLWMSYLIANEMNLSNKIRSYLIFNLKNNNLYLNKKDKYIEYILKYALIVEKANFVEIIENNKNNKQNLIINIADNFRLYFKNKFINMNISEEYIERCLEKYFYCWRNYFFEYEFNFLHDQMFNIKNTDLYIIDNLYRKYWFDVKKYYYYQENKMSIQRYGVISKPMLLDYSVIDKMKKYIIHHQRSYVLKKR